MDITNIAPNATVIEVKGDLILVSYTTKVAIITKTGNAFKTEKKWSKTTSKHINKFFKSYPFKGEVIEREQDYFDSI